MLRRPPPLRLDRLLRRPTVVILTALDLEYQAVRAHLDQPRSWQHPAGTFFEIGRPSPDAGWVAIVRTGEGNTPAALIAERAAWVFQPRAMFFVGTAGALNDTVALTDVVVATKVYAFHGGKAEGNDFLPRPQVFEAPHGLEQLAGHVARTFEWRGERAPVVHFKPIAAGEVLVNSRAGDLAEHLRRNYNDAVAVDMESVGVACAGHLNRSLPVLSIRGVSDHADGTKASVSRPDEAAMNAAAFALALAAAIQAPVGRAA
ncbi:hypothetical protein Val02_57970 [Virgisporangium aliadipatigenens]|uniref:Nucleoside phosphorylase domain-containing protein n=1 Tax=Virgisporangium aliadipatigenens TaxID=741659 RepID=A0A8J4DT66_9ACTN|nr:5'-methylthioadenosine/S-adenosylhomocysteine nucleosidase [Virgisporangium aliadipatigenens]GIJ48911.1 hypothetical protein Val02_57970 [Virgisporangium aliadipatigenens]